MAVEAGEPIHLYCLNCATWIVKFSELHHTTHKDHDIITEEQVKLQGETKAALIESRHPKESKFYIDIPFEIIESSKGNIEKLPPTKIMGDAILEKFHFGIQKNQNST